MTEKTLKELKEELIWLETTPFWIGKDGDISLLLMLFVLITGIVLGIIIILIYKSVRKDILKKQIKELETKNKEKD